MTNEERTCLACGRPLTGRQRKWCNRPDCGGWDSLHPLVMETCECGKTFETYKGSGQKKCPEFRYFRTGLTERICIQCGKKYSHPASQGFLWCSEPCADRYMHNNPQPDYFARDRELSRNGLYLGCGKELEPSQREYGYCSPQCDGIYQVRDQYREEQEEKRILAEEGPQQAKVFKYVRIKQWFEVYPNHARRGVGARPIRVLALYTAKN